MSRSPSTVLAKLALALSALALLGGCATTYEPRSATGGYQERAVGPNRWYVEFFGNGKTTRDTVSAYWLYRCAELTSQKGFDYFVIISKTPPPEARAGVLRVAHERRQGLEFTALKSADAADAPIYVRTATITIWSWHGVIELRKGAADDEERPVFVARTILEKLGPQVLAATQRGRNIRLPRDLFAGEQRQPRSAAGAVRLEDLDALLPGE